MSAKPATKLPSFTEEQIREFRRRESEDFCDALAGDPELARREIQKRIKNLVITPKNTPEGSAKRVDLFICDGRGAEQFRLADIPIHTGASSVAYQESISFLKAAPTTQMIARLVSIDDAGRERLLGEYTFNHTLIARAGRKVGSACHPLGPLRASSGD